MNFLVGSLVLSGGERVVIVWSDGRRTEAVYQDTFGYTHVFLPQGEGQGNPPLQPLYAAEGHPHSACGRASGRAVTAFRKSPASSAPSALSETDSERFAGAALPIRYFIRKVNTMEFRKIFDTIPEQFDRWRPRYCAELFAELIAYAEIGPGKTVLELGPGTGQATDPILHTGCEYCAIELGEHLTAAMLRKYGAFPNFSILNDDFITYDFGGKTFDVIYSAATIQWIPESIAFTKTFDLLKPGGTLAMMRTQGDYKTPNEALYDRIQEVYAAYFKPEAAYVYKQGGFPYANAPLYGFTGFEERRYYGKREFNAEEYVSFVGTHCDHIVLPEPYRSRFLRRAPKSGRGRRKPHRVSGHPSAGFGEKAALSLRTKKGRKRTTRKAARFLRLLFGLPQQPELPQRARIGSSAGERSHCSS